ncbi:MAG: hypothetical protein GU356_04175 [Pyrobaculum sp.]|nr:hypothetical protein [Pyrobaculum sp.]
MEIVNATGVDVETPEGHFSTSVPAGWYLDPLTKTIFRIPSNDTTVMAELQRNRERLRVLEAELANKTAQLAQPNATVAQLDSTSLWPRRGARRPGSPPRTRG